ncbi:hypothetical protein C3K47_06935 [Solitalea longa]|uniref:Lipoprotein n=1 Tax=Solitalea longa TaxID=2079460 RepID=A0A2S5A592_9SPHI|nr:hypothetical protein [Solitalea longa]POY37492.1 hypothetical protein C3K47_06935 [Solitalea longa]
MKKVFALMLAAGVFAVVACGEGKKAEGSADSSVVDSAAAVVDSAAAKVDSAAAVVDSAAAKVDSLKK